MPKKLALAAAAGATALVGAIAPTAHAAPAGLTLPSVTPAWARTAPVVGQTPADAPVFLLFALAQKDPAGEARYGAEATTPGDPLYRQWLSPAEFEARFGALDGAAATVTQALAAVGITNTMTDKLGLTVLAEVPASVASSVFGVRFAEVRHAGQTLRVALNQPTLPTAMVPLVTAVDGFTEHPVHTDHTVEPAVTQPTTPTGGVPKAFFNPQPKSAFFGDKLATDQPTAPALAGDAGTTKPYIVGGYTPAQIRGAYGVDKVTETGKGVTMGVALFYDGPDVSADLAHFSTDFGLAAPNYTDLSAQNQAVTIPAGSAPVVSPADAAGEQTLDVEAIHQMAPDAAIDYSGAVAPYDEAIYVAVDTLIAAGVAAINNSYGGTGDTDAANAQVFQTAVTGPAMTMGVGLDYSSGDSGDDVTGQGARELDFPSSSDQVTAVGGTGIEIGKANDYEGEFYWGTYSAAKTADGTAWQGFASQSGGAGGGGGVSTAYAEPAWQKGVVPAEEAVNADTAASYTAANSAAPTYAVPGSPGRVSPDVAMIADSTTGLLVGETQQPDLTTGATGIVPDTTPAYSYYRIGGTSVSSPIFTGMMALVDQALGKSAGFVNPTMYTFLAKGDGSFRDPQIGRSATGSRSGSTMAQVLTGCSASDATVCTGTGPGVVPVVSEVRPDYTDSANDGQYTATYDPTGLVVTGGTPGNPVVYHLRGQGVLGTLEDLPGYDDSTGLGSPDAPQFIADFVATGGGTPPANAPEFGAPAALVGVGALVGYRVLRRRRRATA